MLIINNFYFPFCEPCFVKIKKIQKNIHDFIFEKKKLIIVEFAEELSEKVPFGLRSERVINSISHKQKTYQFEYKQILILF